MCRVVFVALVFALLAGCQPAPDARPVVIVQPAATAAVQPARTGGAASEGPAPRPTRTPFVLPTPPRAVAPPATAPRLAAGTPGPAGASGVAAAPSAAAPVAPPRAGEALTATVMATATASPVAPPTAAPAQPVVGRVVDGETIEVHQAGALQRVRLIGVRLPRSAGVPECHAAESLAFLRGLLPAGTPVTLEPDAQDQDEKGRLWRYLTIDGRSINAAVVAAGAGTVSLEPPNVNRKAALIDAQRQAIGQANGLWRLCPVAAPMTGPPADLTVDAPPPIRAGDHATITAHTVPGAACVLAYTTPAGTQSRQAALGPRDADAQGRAVWEWTIARNTRPGVGHAVAVCRGVAVRVPVTITAAPTAVAGRPG